MLDLGAIRFTHGSKIAAEFGRRGPWRRCARPSLGFVPAHNWDRYDWGAAPPVGNFHLYQCKFLNTRRKKCCRAPSRDGDYAVRDVVPNFGMGLVTYVTGDFGGNTFRGLDMEKEIEPLPGFRWGRSSTFARPGESFRSGPAALIPTRTGRPRWHCEAIRQARWVSAS